MKATSSLKRFLEFNKSSEFFSQKNGFKLQKIWQKKMQKCFFGSLNLLPFTANGISEMIFWY